MAPAQGGGAVGDEYDRARFLIVLLRYVGTLIWVATFYPVASEGKGPGFLMGILPGPFASGDRLTSPF
jgi:hypothetical protein